MVRYILKKIWYFFLNFHFNKLIAKPVQWKLKKIYRGILSRYMRAVRWARVLGRFDHRQLSVQGLYKLNVPGLHVSPPVSRTKCFCVRIYKKKKHLTVSKAQRAWKVAVFCFRWRVVIFVLFRFCCEYLFNFVYFEFKVI